MLCRLFFSYPTLLPRSWQRQPWFAAAPITTPHPSPPAVAISGYAAFGSAVSSDVLLNLQGAPAAKAANLMVVVHVAAGFQVCSGGVLVTGGKGCMF